MSIHPHHNLMFTLGKTSQTFKLKFDTKDIKCILYHRHFLLSKLKVVEHLVSRFRTVQPV